MIKMSCRWLPRRHVPGCRPGCSYQGVGAGVCERRQQQGTIRIANVLPQRNGGLACSKADSPCSACCRVPSCQAPIRPVAPVLLTAALVAATPAGWGSQAGVSARGADYARPDQPVGEQHCHCLVGGEAPRGRMPVRGPGCMHGTAVSPFRAVCGVKTLPCMLDFWSTATNRAGLTPTPWRPRLPRRLTGPRSRASGTRWCRRPTPWCCRSR